MPAEGGRPDVRGARARSLWRGLLARGNARARREIMNGALADVQIAALLVALRTRGETLDEIVGAAEAMRERRCRCRRLPRARSTPAEPVATARTPSTSPRSPRSSSRARACRSRSTATARPRAAAAAPTCSRRSGVAIEIPPQAMARAVAEIGIGFLYARAVPSGDGARRAGPRGARRAHDLQLPGSAPQPDARAPPAGRRRGRVAGRAHARGAGRARRRARLVVHGAGRARRDHDHGADSRRRVRGRADRALHRRARRSGSGLAAARRSRAATRRRTRGSRARCSPARRARGATWCC